VGILESLMTGAPPFRLLRSTGALVSLALVATSCALMPDLAEERESAGPLSQTSRLFDRNGRLITNLHAEEDRVLIPPGRIPRSVRNAVVAIEDQRFWTHRGIDAKALLRAAYVNLTSGRVEEGGSTITQQYVKNRLLGPERTLSRKFREAALAWQLEKEITKRDILANYLNTVYFGRGAYGIQRAARTFFSRPASKLNLNQAALLAGLIAGPERWDPIDRPEAALDRRNVVLERMLSLEMITPQRYQRVLGAGLRLRPAKRTRPYPAAHFVDYVKHHILTSRRFGETYTERYDFLFKGGLRIHTTIDLDLQAAAEQAVNGILSQPGDPYGAMTVVNPRNGHILAMVGGRDYFAPKRDDRYAKVNLATGGTTGRQAGSAFKPFALVTALEQGLSPSQTYPAPGTITLDDPPCGSPDNPWPVRNYDGSSYGGNLTMEQATISSVNVVYAQIIRDVRPERVVDTARRMGIRSKLRPFCSTVLGTNEVNTLEMASAFGTLARNGKRARPTAIARIDRDGEPIWEWKPRRKQVVNPAVAWVTTQILRKAVLSGTGVAANIGRPQAGKTGTAQQWRDAWFAGYIPQMSVAVWVGFPHAQVPMVPPTTRLRVTGGSFPAQIWRAFMSEATANLPVRDFQRPDVDFVTVAIDVTQGCLPTASTPSSRIRYVQFVPGTEPTRRCTGESAPVTGGVPSVVGMSAGAAYDALTAAGFSVTQTVQQNQNYPSGTVISQSPAPGTQAPAGSTVSLVVASG
jgi:membrane peptidoglycan carboxypeptidase